MELIHRRRSDALCQEALDPLEVVKMDRQEANELLARKMLEVLRRRGGKYSREILPAEEFE